MTHAGPRTAIPVLLVLLIFTVAPVLRSQTPPRDPQPQRSEQPSGKAIIRGRVVVEGTSTPLARVVVSAFPSEAVGLSAPRVAVQRLTSTTDDSGGFEIREVPPGRYILVAQIPHERPQYLSATFGQRNPTDRGKPVDVAEGAVIENIVISARRAGVIAGRVVNEVGEPVAWARVTALLNRTPGAEPVETGPWRETDDLGRFRMFGLVPGSYIVRVEPSNWRPDEEQSRLRYVPIFYPSALSPDEAQPISIEAGQEATEAEIVLRRARTYRITGTAASSAAQAGQVFVMYSRDKRTFSNAAVRPDGSFTITGVQPGEYTLIARTQTMGDPDVEQEMSAPATVRVEQDVDGISLTMQRGARISGHVVLDLESEKAPVSLRVIASSPLFGFSFGMPSTSVVKPDGTFTLSRVFGATVLRVMEGGGRFRLTVRYKGKDITDVPTEFSEVRDARSLEVVLTDKGAQITGRVTNANGLPVTDAVVTAFSADERRWGTWALCTRFAPVGARGSFNLRLLAPGKYLVAAMETEGGAGMGALMGQSDTALFAKLASIATPVEVLENDVREVSLTLSKLPQ